ncbi:chorismate synthase [[Clostridium] symbiosum]|uniref:chorismate synthase n=1 Tax=Clostridium symbiosum TaxID=1512 RepID=UPI001D095615|nr:chorismate synthase [[Clostridium] symbiosum]MCB6608543.1 chorismate synthase [[Clostridium] symbiosum]MCB6932145.1 chorismate synthase [[Clostridium] symbiosum]
MAGSTFGRILTMTTWGESHGAGVGVVVDGCPAGLSLTEEDIQKYLDRRKPGQSRFTTKRSESDSVEILSGVFEGKTTGTPIAMLVRNQDQHSRDYSEIAGYYRPGHADYTFDEKYGFRDYRGGGRSSGRETIARVAAGAVAAKMLEGLGIKVTAYTKAIGPISVQPERFDLEECGRNKLYMPDAVAAAEAAAFLEEKMAQKDSAGGIVECVISGVPAGIGDPVFEKLDANLAKAICSIGAVKGFEIGDGFEAAKTVGSVNNDEFCAVGKDDGQFLDAAGAVNVAGADETAGPGKIGKRTNHAGGVLGGISDGSEIVFRAAFKPTPSIASVQKTVNRDGEEIEVTIKGRHDPIIVPRAVVVVEMMAAFTVADMMLAGMTSKMDRIREFYLI